tara:strand:+ start:503 stop:880 length:378 start_codon:yes stop_codon:yes gene_type:complete
MTIEYPAIAFCGALLTFLLAKHKPFSPVSASSSLSIIAYYFFYYFNLQPELYSAIFFGGTFIGMSAPKRFGVYTITSAAMIFAILFEYLVPKINNYGGALGISAFLSVCACHIFILFGAPRSKKR